MKTNNSFLPLYLTNFFGTLNDNFLKTLASFTVIGWLSDERVKSVAMGVTAGALVLPYILCSPLADRLTAVWRKKKIVRIAKWAELPIMAVAIAGFAVKSPWLVIGAVLLMGLQSSLYSPAKYALVRDIGGEGRISTGMGGMEGVSFLGVLAGTVAGAVVSDPDIQGKEPLTGCNGISGQIKNGHRIRNDHLRDSLCFQLLQYTVESFCFHKYTSLFHQYL